MQTKKMYLFFLVVLFIFSGCVARPEFTYVVSGCGTAENAKILKEVERRGIEPESPVEEELNISIKQNKIAFHHITNHLCCLAINVEHKQYGNKIVITEIFSGEPCECICGSEVNATLGPLQNGTYIINVVSFTEKLNESNVVFEKEIKIPECTADADCFPAQCCHAAACVNKEFAPNCAGVLCTMECRLNTIDCGGGCKCVEGECRAYDAKGRRIA